MKVAGWVTNQAKVENFTKFTKNDTKILFICFLRDLKRESILI